VSFARGLRAPSRHIAALGGVLWALPIAAMPLFRYIFNSGHDCRNTNVIAAQRFANEEQSRTDFRVLVVGDVHGCLVELRELIALAGLGTGDRVIALGDVVDRGPDSAGVLDLLRTSGNVVSLMGNHERKHVRSSRGEVPAVLSQQIVRKELGDRYPAAVAFMETFAPWIELPEALLVHGFWEPGVPLRSQKPAVIIGTLSGEQYLAKHYRQPWYDLYDGDRPLIVGHHDYLHTGSPLIHKDRVYGLDTGCCYGGRLTGLLLPEWRIVSVPSRANYWADIRARDGRSQSAAAPVVWSEEDETSLSELIRHGERIAQETYRSLHAACSGFDAMPAREQTRLFAEMVRENPIAPVVFRIRSGHGTRDAMRSFLGHPSRVAGYLAKLKMCGNAQQPPPPSNGLTAHQGGFQMASPL